MINGEISAGADALVGTRWPALWTVAYVRRPSPPVLRAKEGKKARKDQSRGRRCGSGSRDAPEDTRRLLGAVDKPWLLGRVLVAGRARPLKALDPLAHTRSVARKVDVAGLRQRKGARERQPRERAVARKSTSGRT